MLSNRVFHTSTRVSGKVDGRFSSTATKILNSRFEDHSDHPYPTPQEVHQLQGQTGLSVQQLRDWFANSRRRAKRQFQLHGTADSQTPPTHGSLPRGILRRPDTPLPLGQMDPLQLPSRRRACFVVRHFTSTFSLASFLRGWRHFCYLAGKPGRRFLA